MNTDPRIKFAEMAKHYQAQKLAGVPAHLIMPMGQRGVGVVDPDVGEAVNGLIPDRQGIRSSGCSDPCTPVLAPCNGRM